MKASEEIKSTRSVRHLLIKGAERSTKDRTGRTPMDVAKQIQIPELREEIEKYLVILKMLIYTM